MKILHLSLLLWVFLSPSVFADGKVCGQVVYSGPAPGQGKMVAISTSGGTVTSAYLVERKELSDEISYFAVGSNTSYCVLIKDNIVFDGYFYNSGRNK